jgi:hypothetical protein
MTKSLEKQLIDKHNLVGKKFSKWTVLQYLKGGNYKCQCDCGTIAIKKTPELITMKSMQCVRCRKKELNLLRDNRLKNIPRIDGWSNLSISKEDLDE